MRNGRGATWAGCDMGGSHESRATERGMRTAAWRACVAAGATALAFLATQAGPGLAAGADGAAADPWRSWSVRPLLVQDDRQFAPRQRDEREWIELTPSEPRARPGPRQRPSAAAAAARLRRDLERGDNRDARSIEPAEVTRPSPPRLTTRSPAPPPPSPAATGRIACDYAACAGRYRSFRASDCSYQPFDGPRRQCTVGEPTLSPPPGVQEAETEPPSPKIVTLHRSTPGDARAPARADADAQAPEGGVRRASSSVSEDAKAVLGWFELSALSLFFGFFLVAFVKLWGPPARPADPGGDAAGRASAL